MNGPILCMHHPYRDLHSTCYLPFEHDGDHQHTAHYRPATGSVVEYDDKMVLQLFADLPLTVKMVAAADVLESARTEFHSRPENQNSNWMAIGWTAANLRKYARDWVIAADADKQERRAVEELAQFLCDNRMGDWHDIARTLVESGWKKGQES